MSNKPNQTNDLSSASSTSSAPSASSASSASSTSAGSWASASLKEAYQARTASPQDEAKILERVGQALVANVGGFGAAWAPLSLKEAYQARTPGHHEERESLLRVRQKTLERGPGRGLGPWLAFGKGLGWSSAALGILGLVFFLAGRLSPKEILSPLQSSGIAPLVSADGRRLDFALAALQEARLEAPSRWKVKIFGGSKLSIHRHAAQKTSIQLQRGRLRVEVQPKKGEAFAVSHQGWRVIVEGTGFSVEHEASWLRVEVWSGRVLLQGPKESLALQAGHGARIHLPTGRIATLSAPLDPEGSFQTRLRWLGKQPSSLLMQEILDLLERPSLQGPERIVLLQEAIQTFFQRGEMASILPLSRLYHAAEKDRLAQETFLYPLLLLCYKRSSPKDCLPLSGHYLRAFGALGMRPFVARIHFLHATALLKDKVRLTAGLRMLQRHREDFPKGFERRRVCDQIQSVLRQAPPDLAPIQKEIGPATPWFKKHCIFH